MIERGNFKPQPKPVISDKVFYVLRVMSWICFAGTLLGLVMLIASTYILVFSTVALGMLCMVMAVKINDRNRELYDLYEQRDHLSVKMKNVYRELEYMKARAGGEYLEPVHVVRERRKAAAERKQLIPITEIRIGDAERDVVISRLGDHYAAGRLDRDELDERMDKATKAKTGAQLSELLRDLP